MTDSVYSGLKSIGTILICILSICFTVCGCGGGNTVNGSVKGIVSQPTAQEEKPQPCDIILIVDEYGNVIDKEYVYNCPEQNP